MVEEDLVAFGRQLTLYRKADSYTQEKLAEILVNFHARSAPKKEMRLDSNRISKWENAYVDKKSGRVAKPSRLHMRYLIELFVAQLNPETAQVWAAQAGYVFGWHELEPIFGKAKTTTILPAKPTSPATPPSRLFGITKKFEQLLALINQPDGNWLLAICGIGGIGKTALAEFLLATVKSSGRFQDIAWVSAKQQEFLPYDGARQIDQPALDEETLVNTLLEQLSEQSLLARPLPDKIVSLIELVKSKPMLMVVDNLETAVDYEALLPLLRRLTNPSKVLLTSRVQLHGHSDVHNIGLDELGEEDALSFLRYEGEARGLDFVAKAATKHLQSIYGTVGGNPLALKLVVGQLAALPLDQVLESLRAAEGKQVDELYTYIYWQAWHALDEAGRHTLLLMPLIAHQGGTFDHLLAVSELDAVTLRLALAQLVRRSLVEVRGDIAERRYAIHRLTETFLLNDVLGWEG